MFRGICFKAFFGHPFVCRDSFGPFFGLGLVCICRKSVVWCSSTSCFYRIGGFFEILVPFWGLCSECTTMRRANIGSQPMWNPRAPGSQDRAIQPSRRLHVRLAFELGVSENCTIPYAWTPEEGNPYVVLRNPQAGLVSFAKIH